MRPLDPLKLSGSRFHYGRKNQPSAHGEGNRTDANCAGWRSIRLSRRS